MSTVAVAAAVVVVVVVAAAAPEYFFEVLYIIFYNKVLQLRGANGRIGATAQRHVAGAE